MTTETDQTTLYRTTALAGFWVAGQRMPVRANAENGQPEPVPGSSISLTADQAKYELLNGTIELAETGPGLQKPARTETVRTPKIPTES